MNCELPVRAWSEVAGWDSRRGVARGWTGVFCGIVLPLVLVLALGRPAGAEEPRVVATPGGLRPQVARVDARGVIHLVAHSPTGPRYCQSRDGGETWSAPTAIVTSGDSPAGLEFEVWDVAVSPAGDVHVALGTNAWKLKRPHSEWGLHYTRRPAAADQFEPLRNINTRPSEGFALAVSPRGRVTATWMADRLYANVSTDGGDTFGPIVEFDPTADPCNCCTTSATYGSDGRLAVLYREETNNDRDMHVVLWDQAGERVTRRAVSRKGWRVDACPMTYYSLVADGEGYLAAWPTRGELHFTRLNADGEPTARMETATGGKTGMRTGVLGLPGPDGSQLLVWKKEGELHWQAYDRGFRPVGSPGQVASPGAGAAGVRTERGMVLFR